MALGANLGRQKLIKLLYGMPGRTIVTARPRLLMTVAERVGRKAATRRTVRGGTPSLEAPARRADCLVEFNG